MIVIFLFVGVVAMLVSHQLLKHQQGWKEAALESNDHHAILCWKNIPLINHLFLFEINRNHRCNKGSLHAMVDVGCFLLSIIVYAWGKPLLFSLLLFSQLVILFVLAIIDYKTLKVPSYLLFAYCLLSVSTMFFPASIKIENRLLGLSFTIVYIALYYFWKNSIGDGDLYFIASCGFQFGVWGFFAILQLSYFIAGVMVLFLLMARKIKQGSAIPMFPFFFLSLILYLSFFEHFVTIPLL